MVIILALFDLEEKTENCWPGVNVSAKFFTVIRLSDCNVTRILKYLFCTLLYGSYFNKPVLHDSVKTEITFGDWNCCFSIISSSSRLFYFCCSNFQMVLTFWLLKIVLLLEWHLIHSIAWLVLKCHLDLYRFKFWSRHYQFGLIFLVQDSCQKLASSVLSLVVINVE